MWHSLVETKSILNYSGSGRGSFPLTTGYLDDAEPLVQHLDAEPLGI